ncbi:MAG: UbiA family prenyltransferase [candidate division WOR-3 bacterium]
MSLFFVLVIAISLLTKEAIRKVTPVAGVGLSLIIFVPIIDWLVGNGYSITYPLRLKPFLVHFLNPTKSLTDIGVSSGQRIIIVIIVLLISLYAYLKRKKVIIAFSLLIISFALILLFGALPTLIALDKPETIYLTGGILFFDQQKFSAIFALIFLFSFFVYYYRSDKANFRSVIWSFRYERMAFYSGLGLFGFILGMHQQSALGGLTPKANLFNIIGIILLLLSLAIGFQSAQVINDFFDIEADRLTRKRNPLVQGLNRNYYLIWGLCLIFLSLTFALIINYSCFLLMITYLLLSVIYSVPPVRLKRIPIVSTFILAVAAILAMAMGYSLTYGNYALNAIPKTILIPTILGITFGFIAKDIQDAKSDRSIGVITIPNLLYKDSIVGRSPIAILIGVSFLCYIIFIPKVLIGAIICSVLTIIYTIFSRRPKEWFYFIMLYSFGIYLLTILLKD